VSDSVAVAQSEREQSYAPREIADQNVLIRSWRVLVFIGIALVAFALRMTRLDYFNLSGDETITGTFSTHSVVEIIDALRNGEPHPPLLYLAYHLWIPLAGDSEFSLRFPSVLAGVTIVAVTYVTGKRLLSRCAGLLAAAYVMLSPYQLWNAQDARMYSFATLFCLVALYSTARLLDVPTVTADFPGDRKKWCVFYVASMTLALFTHYYSAYTFGLLNVFALAVIVLRRLRGFGTWAIAQVTVIGLYAPWVVLGWKTITTYHGNGVSPTLLQALSRTFDTFATGYVLAKSATLPVAAIAALLLAAGVVRSCRRSRASTALLLLSLLTPVFGVFLASLGRPVFNERYLMAASPGFCLLVGALALDLPKGVLAWVRAGALAINGALIVANVWLATRYVTATTTVEKARDASAFGVYLASQVSPADRVLFNTIDPTFAYYYRKAHGSAPTLVAPARPDETLPQLDAQLSASLAGAERVLVVPDGLHVWDTRNLLPDWLTRHEVWLSDQRPSHQIVVYGVIHAKNTIAIRYGDSMRLVGYSLSDEALSHQSELVVTLLWQTSDRLTTDYTVSVQLLDSAGTLVAQSDGQPHDPQGGSSATTTWRTSETVPDKHVIELPLSLAKGQYGISVAVYDLATLKRLPVDGSSDGLARLGLVEVG
jgi:mannosyltransferase